ncbi:NAD(P)H-dependent oxidoreductase [uncultured Massilia sp.]|uniref:glutathione-regulated potassium-efflux system oxidoreductase KefF n=1 Tax=uncultured Massilia sp. TaxID=169973 RepID=UPI0025EA00C3|nr:NAD(P)H-dependent oxidoreductase [uncultured Massilia sp.]
MSEPSILVIYAHPAPQRSPVNRRLVEEARAVPGVRVQDLYELYPDFDIDGETEHALLAAAHLVVFLHPFRWYGMPSMLKEWMEVVLQPGWAYGKGECALRGKGYWLVTTTGSGPEAYRPGGLHGRPFADFLAPFEQTAALCGMDWIEPLVMHGAARADAAAIDAHAAEFRRRLAGYAGMALAAATPYLGEA